MAAPPPWHPATSRGCAWPPPVLLVHKEGVERLEAARLKVLLLLHLGTKQTEQNDAIKFF